MLKVGKLSETKKKRLHKRLFVTVGVCLIGTVFDSYHKTHAAITENRNSTFH